jgi:hypothetical protein
VKLSNARLKTFRRCEKQYEFKYVYDLRSKKKSRPLELGSWVHDLLMVWTDGEDWKLAHRERAKAFASLFEEEREEMGDVPNDALRLFKAYMRQYREEDRGIKVLDTEVDETIELPNGLTFQFIIDCIIEDRAGDVWFKDYKTLSRFMDPEFMILDPQLSLYFWGGAKLGIKAHGVMYDELRTKAPTIPRLLQSGELSKAKNIDSDYWTYLREIKRHGLDPKDYMDVLRRLHANRERFFRRTRLPRERPVIKTTLVDMVSTAQEMARSERKGQFPRTPDKISCPRFCEFYGPCLTQLQGGHIDKMLKRDYEPRKKEDD